ncbi:hypothetical protein [Actinomadura roseirufa]|uniref:hypothetical protein n=1 Tax=Actinomadura roseirufa TaxID=2094049 RepID=UPI0010418348|nr:hypothetical protein [Actinomadura roseirufa]
MTGGPARDIDPPEGVAPPEPPWELWLGHDLEQYFGFFTEIHYVASGEFPDEVLDQLATVRRWTVHQLRQLRLPDVLVDAVDDAMADVRPLTAPSVITDHERWRRRRAVGQTFELLTQLTRAHVPPLHRRYYDFGVMLRQITTRAVMIRTAPGLPDWVGEHWPGLAGRYRDELRRECGTLVSFVRDKGPERARPRAPRPGRRLRRPGRSPGVLARRGRRARRPFPGADPGRLPQGGPVRLGERRPPQHPPMTP